MILQVIRPSGSVGYRAALSRRRSSVQVRSGSLAESFGVLSADVAQLAEQLICNQQVIGSIPIVGF